MAGDHVRSGLNALDHEGGHHEGHDSVLGNADAHERYEAGACGRFVGRGLAGHTFDSARSDLLLIFAETLIDGIGRELRNHGTTTGQDPKERADHAAAQSTGDDALELWPSRNEIDLAIERRA